jgi:hypothetical protein
MELANLLTEYLPALKSRFGSQIRSDHYRAIAAILRCRTPAAGEMVIRCPECSSISYLPHSCGHRSCPKCQNHETSTWLDRQRQKLLPIPYFLVTFTLPAPLRSLAQANSREFFEAMFQASAEALQKLGADPRFLGGQVGMTGVLHTHNRRLGFHPHIHYLFPGGAIDQKMRFWKRKDWHVLFPEPALSRIFRGKLLEFIQRMGWALPEGLPKGDWVVNCKKAGSGDPALKYLSRYLYRGIVAEKRIVRNQGGMVTFRYRESKTGQWRERTLPGEEFLWLVLQHVLPRGFRRTRDFGFLHGNARKSLRLVQLLLQAKVPIRELRPRPVFRCPDCAAAMAIIAVRSHRERHPTGPP